MARTVRNAKLDSRSARAKLQARREPYWQVITKGGALGYRKGSKGGNWIARYRDDLGKQHYNALGAADDALDAEGAGLSLSYAEAQRAAASWFELAARGFEEATTPTGPYTVRAAMDDYMAAYTRRGGKDVGRTQVTIDALIAPVLGDVLVAKLTKRKIEAWLDALAKASARIRTKEGAAQKFRAVEAGPEGARRRKSTANRVLTTLKAALNLAHQERKVASDDAWRGVKPFREADAARVRYLNDEEARRLVNASPADFRKLVQAALLTGCRYGELIALQAADFDQDAGTLQVRVSKSGKPRHVVLTDEGRQFFGEASTGKSGRQLLLTRADGLAWGKSHQARPMATACAAGNVPVLSFHELRHSYASRLVKKGVPLVVVAAQLGHSGTRMVEKHYAHLAPSHIADTVRAAFTSMGVVEASNVVPLRKAE